jgi:hypothetical protein
MSLPSVLSYEIGVFDYEFFMVRCSVIIFLFHKLIV